MFEFGLMLIFIWFTVLLFGGIITIYYLMKKKEEGERELERMRERNFKALERALGVGDK